MAPLAAGLLQALALAVDPGLAEPVSTIKTERRAFLTAAELFDLADRAYAAGNHQLAARALLALAENPDQGVRNESRFRLALAHRAAGRNRDAALLLRRILDEQPQAARVRLELAATLQTIGDGASALRELRALRSSQLPPNVARFVDRLSAGLQATRPLGFHVEFALAPDTNINRATRSDTLETVVGDFGFEEDAKAHSGLGAAVRGIADVRLPVSDRFQLVGRATGDANIYRHTEFNDITVELAGGSELQLGRTRLSLEAALGQHWFGMKSYQRSFRLAAGAMRPLGSVSQLRLDGSLRLVNNHRNDLQDGRGVSGRVRFERALSPRFLLSASVGADRFKAEDDAYSTMSWSGGLTGYRDMGRMTLITGIEIGRLKADERLTLLPEAREDLLTRLHLGTVFRQLTFKGFAPMTRVVIERNRSSVEFYDYKRTRTEFGVSRAF